MHHEKLMKWVIELSNSAIRVSAYFTVYKRSFCKDDSSVQESCALTSEKPESRIRAVGISEYAPMDTFLGKL